MRLRLLALLPLLPLAGWATPLHLDQVPATSAWFGHLDLDRTDSGKIGALAKDLRTQLQARDNHAAALLLEIRGITAYGDGTPKDINFLVSYAGSAKTMRDRFTQTEGVTTRTVEGVTLYSLPKQKDADAMFFVIPESGPILVTDSESRLVAAAKRPAGKGLTPPAEWTACLGNTAPIIVFGGFPAKLPADTVQSEQLRQLQSLSGLLAEEGDHLRIRFRGTAASAAAASGLAELAKALQALGQAGSDSTGSEKQFADVLRAVKVETQGAQIGIDAAIPVSALEIAAKLQDETTAAKGEDSEPKEKTEPTPPSAVRK